MGNLTETYELPRRSVPGTHMTLRSMASLLVLAFLLGSCERERREVRLDPPVSAALDQIALMQNGISGTPPRVYVALGRPYETNAYNLSEGKRLYEWFGCNTCHGDGQGGVGPSFLDGWWYYGPEMVSIFASIRDGRPHGMPAFRDKMTTEQIWQLAGYVQTIGEYSAKTAAPGRNDDKHTRPAENRAPAAALFDQGPTPLHLDQGPDHVP
jgi:cytochrome c oxidase cbb3-type subunit III